MSRIPVPSFKSPPRLLRSPLVELAPNSPARRLVTFADQTGSDSLDKVQRILGAARKTSAVVPAMRDDRAALELQHHYTLLHELTGQTELLHKQVDLHESEVDAAVRTERQLARDVEQLARQVRDATREVDTQAAAVTAAFELHEQRFQLQLAELDAQIATDLEALRHTLEQELASAQAYHDVDAEAAAARLRTDAEEWEAKRQCVRDELQQLEDTEAAELGQASAGRLASVRAQLEVAEKNAVAAEAALADATALCQQHETETTRLELEIAAVRASMDVLQQQEDRATTTVHDLREEEVRLHSEVAECQRALDAAESRQHAAEEANAETAQKVAREAAQQRRLEHSILKFTGSQRVVAVSGFRTPPLESAVVPTAKRVLGYVELLALLALHSTNLVAETLAGRNVTIVHCGESTKELMVGPLVQASVALCRQRQDRYASRQWTFLLEVAWGDGVLWREQHPVTDGEVAVPADPCSSAQLVVTGSHNSTGETRTATATLVDLRALDQSAQTRALGATDSTGVAGVVANGLAATLAQVVVVGAEQWTEPFWDAVDAVASMAAP